MRWICNFRSIAGGYGDRNSGGGDGMVTQEDTIFVSGMDPSISEEEICQHFGAIGVIKVRIRIYRRHVYISSVVYIERMYVSRAK